MDNKTGLIFHIIRGSFVDGHGLRTTVFLKGCPMKCVWCCNPEGQADHPEIKFTPSECDGCGKCIPICPANAISPDPESGNDKIIINRELCDNCGECVEVCYQGALSLFGRYITEDELFDIVRKDQDFYHASKGGVTLGGGEPSFQPLFTYSFLKRCRENYIHTAVDTCGYTLNDEGFRVLEEADLLLFDLKGMIPEEHLKNTGVSNQPVLENLKRLDAMGKPIIIRIPVIPGHNDSSESIESIAGFLSGIKSVERVDLIGYHGFGIVKYGQLGKDYKLKDVHVITEERLKEISQVFQDHGLNVQLGG
ncbi:glycyl-radical enzyme activating protein [Deltaproteobacteria bacterium]|nr:glycyl-radical enzyme activating protein [Deltaproteobacteria bacterium]